MNRNNVWIAYYLNCHPLGDELSGVYWDAAFNNPMTSHFFHQWVHPPSTFHRCLLHVVLMCSLRINQPFHLIALYCVVLSLCSLVNSTLCHSGIYGTPAVLHCQEALSWIPFANINPRTKAYPISREFRYFAEPQHMVPPFSSLNNIARPKGIVQLPKIWKYRKLSGSLVPDLSAKGKK